MNGKILKVTKPLAKVFPKIRTWWGEYGFHEENYRQQFNDEDVITFIEIVDEMKIKPYLNLSEHCYYLDEAQADIERENIKQARDWREKMGRILYEIEQGKIKL